MMDAEEQNLEYVEDMERARVRALLKATELEKEGFNRFMIGHALLKGSVAYLLAAGGPELAADYILSMSNTVRDGRNAPELFIK